MNREQLIELYNRHRDNPNLGPRILERLQYMDMQGPKYIPSESGSQSGRLSSDSNDPQTQEAWRGIAPVPGAGFRRSFTPTYEPNPMQTNDPMNIEYPQRPMLQEARGLQQEPNVPEWAGRYPNVYGGLGMAREMIQPFMRGSLLDVGLSRAVGYSTPEFMTKNEMMSLPALVMVKWGQGQGFSERRMSPETFLSEADNTMATKYPGWQTQPIERKAVEHYKSKILKGEQVDPMYIDKAGLAEGRHRATAYKELGYKEVPVHVKEAAIPEQRTDYGLRDKIQRLKDEGDVEQLHKLIYEDPLTSVLNRRAFEEVAPVAAQQGKNFAPMDASGLKYINDTYGHAAGDSFLKEYTKALKDEGVDLYRTGGDEMVAIFGKGDYGKLKRAAHNFSNKEIQVKDLKGNPVTLKGAKFDFGVGKTLESGDVSLYKKRAGQEARGERAATGEKPVGLSEFTKEEALAELARRRQQ